MGTGLTSWPTRLKCWGAGARLVARRGRGAGESGPGGAAGGQLSRYPHLQQVEPEAAAGCSDGCGFPTARGTPEKDTAGSCQQGTSATREQTLVSSTLLKPPATEGPLDGESRHLPLLVAPLLLQGCLHVVKP